MPLTLDHIADASVHGVLAGVAVWQIVVGLVVMEMSRDGYRAKRRQSDE